MTEELKSYKHYLEYNGRILVRSSLDTLRKLRANIPGCDVASGDGAGLQWGWPADYKTFCQIIQRIGLENTFLGPDFSSLYIDNSRCERLCVVCKQFYFDGGSPGYSELTPGSDASMSCLARMWDKKAGCGYFDLTHIGSAKEYRDLIRQAATCPLFSPAKD